MLFETDWIATITGKVCLYTGGWIKIAFVAFLQHFAMLTNKGPVHIKRTERERERDRVMVECKSFAWRNLLCYQPILLENEATRHHYNTLSSEKKWQWLSSGTMFLADACFATWLTHLVQWHTGNWGRFFTRDIKKEQKEQQTHTIKCNQPPTANSRNSSFA